MVEIKEKYRLVSWDEIEDLCFHISRKIEVAEYKPDIITAISRGGLIPARLIQDHLQVPELTFLQILFYQQMDKVVPEPIIVHDISLSVRDKNVLVIDDVVDSGRSLKVACEHLRKRGAYSFRTATLYKKPWSLINPDFFISETDFWLIFPWEISETIVGFYQKFKEKGLGEEEIRAKLIELGFEQNRVDDLLAFHKRYKRI
ncbi:MAG: phosphoribosyltransferase [Candidatus Nanoarchaeia archaeon]|nr:phosphoribosyltransferase [Candidatus Haiyanarchaeum thermophilum]MCW1303391.1 phosphoribosyltransferase [Candidatus Haiyanarchaeum thermophilum]MCW1303921.1 phosphoribosyltransferase [Candidatus Haiyanarchaeum thermophilum]MCW1306753.1 phosphoribosyltransferase [Candidatus Haiyanarchaeum thermophilum]MCW1307418.1 phosphoribosyltransferase [Candidatus Haiyanarchaeum thermophilum]